jgi:hypothetical protein
MGTRRLKDLNLRRTWSSLVESRWRRSAYTVILANARDRRRPLQLRIPRKYPGLLQVSELLLYVQRLITDFSRHLKALSRRNAPFTSYPGDLATFLVCDASSWAYSAGAS